jgi:thiamine biosynthesis lipoprotein
MVTARRDESFGADIIGPVGLAPQEGIWSVTARSAWRADALTKVAAIAPAKVRAELLARLGGQLA